jgi:prepilin-type processing-associated H-X9-DG protein
MPGKSLAALDETAKWAMLIEETQADAAKDSTDDGYYAPFGSDHVSSRHLEGSNIAFLDGHVKWFRPDKAVADAYFTGGQTGLSACP